MSELCCGIIGALCVGNSSSIRYTAPISLPPSAFFGSSPAAAVASQSLIKGKALVFDNCHWAASSSSTITRRRRRRHGMIIVASSSDVSSSIFDDWKPLKPTSTPSLSDILWPSAAMALLGKMDQLLAPKGLSMTIAPLGAVSAVLFATPSAPSARKYNMFMAQIGCAAIGVLAFTIFGPGWLARSAGLSACIAYMIYTGTIHPPAASLPLLFIDGVKLHHLNLWYAFFPGAAGCILLSLIQDVVVYLKSNFKF